MINVTFKSKCKTNNPEKCATIYYKLLSANPSGQAKEKQYRFHDMNISVELGTVNVVIFARGNFRENVGKAFQGAGGVKFHD